ncbi:MAG: hypothetical protein R3B84_22805 [Zavarzinella sp.]
MNWPVISIATPFGMTILDESPEIGNQTDKELTWPILTRYHNIIHLLKGNLELML